jgi:hypothetical protein
MLLHDMIRYIDILLFTDHIIGQHLLFTYAVFILDGCGLQNVMHVNSDASYWTIHFILSTSFRLILEKHSGEAFVLPGRMHLVFGSTSSTRNYGGRCSLHVTLAYEANSHGTTKLPLSLVYGRHVECVSEDLNSSPGVKGKRQALL